LHKIINTFTRKEWRGRERQLHLKSALLGLKRSNHQAKWLNPSDKKHAEKSIALLKIRNSTST